MWRDIEDRGDDPVWDVEGHREPTRRVEEGLFEAFARLDRVRSREGCTASRRGSGHNELLRRQAIPIQLVLRTALERRGLAQRRSPNSLPSARASPPHPKSIRSKD